MACAAPTARMIMMMFDRRWGSKLAHSRATSRAKVPTLSLSSAATCRAVEMPSHSGILKAPSSSIAVRHAASRHSAVRKRSCATPSLCHAAHLHSRPALYRARRRSTSSRTRCACACRGCKEGPTHATNAPCDPLNSHPRVVKTQAQPEHGPSRTSKTKATACNAHAQGRRLDAESVAWQTITSGRIQFSGSSRSLVDTQTQRHAHTTHEGMTYGSRARHSLKSAAKHGKCKQVDIHGTSACTSSSFPCKTLMATCITEGQFHPHLAAKWEAGRRVGG